MFDITGNVLHVGDRVVALTTINRSSKSKRLFHAVITEIKTTNTCEVFCYETKRRVSLTRKSLVKPLED